MPYSAFMFKIITLFRNIGKYLSLSMVKQPKFRLLHRHGNNLYHYSFNYF